MEISFLLVDISKIMKSYEKIAQILRTDKDNIRFIEERFSAITGKKNIIDKIVEENKAIMKNRLNSLGLKEGASAKNIYDALIKKIGADNDLLTKALRLDASETQDCSIKCKRVLEAAQKVTGTSKGFFLKKKKAIELLKNQPPRKIIKSLGYRDINEVLEKEDIYEIFSALRFLEDPQWLNEVFFKQYENLKPEDFEEREIVLRSLDEKWIAAAEAFVKKKYHNISHLKEMGVIFVIPITLGIAGELMRMFILILHYLNEVPFYSNLFRKFAEEEKTFASKIISLLRGDVFDEHLAKSDEGKSRWMIIQRYLAKDDKNDWRLFEPHLNPEALHWERAEEMLVRAGGLFDGFSKELSFWQNLNWVGDYYKSDTGIDVLASFNLIDTTMSLVMEKDMIKYLYHHQESLWNKIFAEYFGEEEMEKKMKENIIKGWFEI